MVYDQKLYGREYWQNRQHLEAKHYWLVSDWTRHFSPKRVLDFGAGMGQFTKVFQDLGFECVGFEPSDYAYKNRQTLNVTNDLDAIKKQNYDLVLCMDVMEHLDFEEVPATLELLRSLTSKWVLFSICFKGDPNFELDPTHKLCRTKEWWEYQIRNAGFELEEVPKNWQFSWQFIIARRKDGQNIG